MRVFPSSDFCAAQMKFGGLSSAIFNPQNTAMEKTKMMKAISAKVGDAQAIEIVMHAYNTELVTTWLSHLETNKPGLATKRTGTDHLADALERVKEVCDLT